MKLKEWNNLDQETRFKLAKVVFALEEDKIDEMSNEWHHNLDEDHKTLLKAISVKGDMYKVSVLV